MYCKKLSICVAASTTASLFISIAEIRKCRAQTLSHLPDSPESVVKSKYKSPFYKLWQYATKNKPSPYNDGVVHYNDTSYRQIQRIFTSYKCYLNFFLQRENYIKQVISRESQRSLSLKSPIFSRHCNNISWRNLLCFIPHIDLVSCVLTYVRNLLRKERSHHHEEYSKLNNPVQQIYKIKRQRQKASNRISIYINKILRSKVQC
ncbi:hypothetical protein MEE_00060 [Bartonella elizabethae F9251 = ATCC 49927]|uniref:Uncharacterized protein n=1 Tax=Bartonella elizabethae F9251 = ATCC 49927 TaxID=1094555 RepID=J1KHJ5_BAREL|nr:hypothetical protein MEE_00060 [Bartonella elizabethae F9251 = ATCC 49927]VEJ42034.1 Uncharacterised protein [Bartonella elizabethae]